MMQRFNLCLLICALTVGIGCGDIDTDDEAEDGDDDAAEATVVDNIDDNADVNHVYNTEPANDQTDKKDKSDKSWDFKYDDKFGDKNYTNDKFDTIWDKKKDDKQKDDKKDEGKDDKSKQDKKDQIKEDYKYCKQFQDEHKSKKSKYLDQCKSDKKSAYYEVCKNNKAFWSGIKCKAYKSCKKNQEGYDRCKAHQDKWADRDCQKFAKEESSEYLSSGIDNTTEVYFALRDMSQILKNCSKRKTTTPNCKFAKDFVDFISDYKSGQFVSHKCIQYEMLIKDCKQVKEDRLAKLKGDEKDHKYQPPKKEVDKAFYEKMKSKDGGYSGCNYAEYTKKYPADCGCDCTAMD